MSDRVRLRVCLTSNDVMAAATESVVAAARAAIDRAGRFVIVLAGGGTPQALYRRLAARPTADRIDWERVHVFWGDERCVPPSHKDSNYRMAREALLDHVGIPSAQIHRMRGEDDPHAAASAYESELRAAFPGAEPRFDLVLLGMGDNGHTASLFPGLTAVSETERWVVAEIVPEMSMWRLTLTPPAINAASEILFVVTGPAKAAMLRQVLYGPHDPAARPAQAIAPTAGQVTWLVDQAAAAGLGPPQAGAANKAQ